MGYFLLGLRSRLQIINDHICLIKVFSCTDGLIGFDLRVLTYAGNDLSLLTYAGIDLSLLTHAYGQGCA